MKLIFALILCLPAFATDSTSGASALFDNIKDLLVRVKAADAISSPKTSYGTGFVVNSSGILATNYHVISDYVMQSGNQWKIIVEVQTDKKETQNFEAELIDVDVVNDLALIRIKKTFSSAIKIEDRDTAKGERTFSLGLPNDINMSLVEGVYNGVLNYGPYSIVHVTTPLNGGMSGGPTLNTQGRVVGVNDARVLFANDISFIVPADKLKNLIDKADIKRAALTKEQARDKIYAQLEASQDRLYKSLTSDKTQNVELWKGRTIQLPDYFKCWSGGSEEPQLPYVLKKRSCRLDHAVFLAGELDTGTLNVDIDFLESSKINPFSVVQLIGQGGALDSFISGLREDKFFGDIDAREIFSPYECQHSFIKARFLGFDKTLRSGLCIRKFVKSKDLYDFSLNWYDFESPLKVRVSINHSGVSLENSKKLLHYWMERLK